MKKRSFWLGDGEENESDHISDQPKEKSGNSKESSLKEKEDATEKGKVKESD
jgi:hypothetical protein